MNGASVSPIGCSRRHSAECLFVLPRGTQCPQRGTRLVRAGERPYTFCYYHEKVLFGLSLETFDYLGEHEIHNLLHGRVHGDGRRLDHYVVAGDRWIEEDTLRYSEES